MSTSSLPSNPEFVGTVYRPLKRAVDDASLNFIKIRDQKLWEQHDADKARRRQSELDAILKKKTLPGSNGAQAQVGTKKIAAMPCRPGETLSPANPAA